MIKFPGSRLLALGLVGVLLGVAIVTGAVVVQAAAQAKKHNVRSVGVHKRLIARKLVQPRQAFAAKAVAAKKPVVAARPVAKPVAKVVVRPPTPKQLLAAKLQAAPKTAFRAPAPRPLVVARPPVKVALARPAPYRPAPVAPIARPVSLTPASQTPPTIVIRPGGPELLSQRGDWSAFRSISGDTRTCFVATRPKDSWPRLADRKPAFLYLTTYAPGDVRNEVTFKLGMPLDTDTSIVAVVDGHNYRLRAAGDMAYPGDIGVQRAMLDGLRRGNSLTLRTAKADAPLGSAPIMTDAFSLLGLAAAMKASDDACVDPTGRR